MTQQSAYATIPGFEEMSAQDIFNLSASHLLKQRKRCESDEETCLYRKDGMACAAGVFLTDEGAKKADSYADKGGGGLAWDAVVAAGLAPDHHTRLILDLQGVHDGSDDPELWRDQLHKLAAEYQLNSDVCSR